MKPILRSFVFLTLAQLLPCHAQEAEKAYKSEISVTPLLKTQTDAAGKPITWPTGTPEVTAVRVEIPPGKQTGWHRHPVPCFAYVLEGELSVELEGVGTKIVKAGEAFTEAVNVLHNGTNKGTTPVKLVMFVAGESNKPYAERPSAAEPAKPAEAPANR